MTPNDRGGAKFSTEPGQNPPPLPTAGAEHRQSEVAADFVLAPYLPGPDHRAPSTRAYRKYTSRQSTESAVE